MYYKEKKCQRCGVRETEKHSELCKECREYTESDEYASSEEGILNSCCNSMGTLD